MTPLLVTTDRRGKLSDMSGFSVSRRSFLAGAGAWLGLRRSFSATPDPEESVVVSLLHTTDIHGHIVPTQTYDGVQNVGGFARCATQIRRWRRESPHSLLVDLGDVYQGTAAGLLHQGNLMMKLFNRLGYDAWTLGNHDFDWGREALESNLALSASPILTGNLNLDGKPSGQMEGVWKRVVPWTMKEAGGFRIALVGLITPGLPYWLAPETLEGAAVEDPIPALKRSIAEARDAQADAVVVMAHMGWRKSDDFANPLRELLRGAPGVDVLLAGHSHQIQPSWNIGDVLCSQAAYYGIHCGRLDLTFDPATRKLIGRHARTVLMDESFEADPAVMETAAPDLKTASEQLARKVAVVKNRIDGKGRGSALVRLFCECFMDSLKSSGSAVDGVFHGTFGTGDLMPGELTVGDCWKLLPYENLLGTAKLSAKELIEVVREDRARYFSDRTLWPFDLEFNSSDEVTRFELHGKPVAADAEFTIAFNSYDMQSGSKNLMRLREIVSQPDARRKITSIDTRGALIDGLLKRGSIG